VVVDFTQMSDREILGFFKKYKGQACGKFRSSQVDRDLRPSIEVSQSMRNTAAALLITAATTGLSSAQTPGTPRPVSPLPQQLHIEHSRIPDSVAESNLITGRVLESNSKEPLIGANIFIAELKIGTVSDLDGNFTLNVGPAQEETVLLQVSYVGFERKLVNVDLRRSRSYDIYLKPSDVLVGEVEITEPPILRALLGAVAISNVIIETDYEDASTEPEKPADLQVKPNPFQQSLHVELTNMTRGNYQFYLFDMSGKEIWAGSRKLEDGLNTLVINFPVELLNGSYVFHVRSRHAQLSSTVVRHDGR
jgi:hypothetical protein